MAADTAGRANFKTIPRSAFSHQSYFEDVVGRMDNGGSRQGHFNWKKQGI
jgi:hypothetical protein